MYLYNNQNVQKSQLYKNTYNKLSSVYIKFLNSLKVYHINFDLNLIKKKEDIEYLLYELKLSDKNENEHTFRCKNCTIKNNISLYNEVDDKIMLQCEYCNSYRTYSKEEVLPKINRDLLIFENIQDYKISIDKNMIELHIVESIN